MRAVVMVEVAKLRRGACEAVMRRGVCDKRLGCTVEQLLVVIDEMGCNEMGGVHDRASGSVSRSAPGPGPYCGGPRGWQTGPTGLCVSGGKGCLVGRLRGNNKMGRTLESDGRRGNVV